MRLYSIRNWIEQGCKQVKGELGWAGFQVRSDIAIRRNQVLVNCAFSFCWAAWFAHPPPPAATPPVPGAGGGERGPDPAARHRAGPRRSGPCAPGWPLDHAATLVGRLVERAPPPQLQALISSEAAGCGLHLYIPN